MVLPDGLISYGPLANCTLALCPVSASVYEYRPSLGANSAFIALFGIALIVHFILGFRWKTWWFTICMVLGCIDEMIGYGGRVMLYKNPFNFTGFIMQIVTITIGPVFFAAAIYVTLSRIVLHLGREYSRFNPVLFYYIFIPCDLVSLVLQATGGAMSSNSHGSSQTGVNIALAGLAFQVFTLLTFIALSLDYVFRWRRASDRDSTLVTSRFRIFAVFLSLSIMLILIRCAYRIAELQDGYHGPYIHNQGEFIGLESVMIILASFTLLLANPGPALSSKPSSIEAPPAEPKRYPSDTSENARSST